MSRHPLMAALVAIACTAGIGAPASGQSPHTHEHSFSGAEAWAKVFDDPKRDAWQKPHEVIQALRLRPDAVVADIGAGTGYFAMRLAHMVPGGRVYAVDTEPDMVRHLAERAKRAGLQNLSVVAAAPDDPRLPQKVDVVLLVDVYHHLGEREKYFSRLAGSLKPGARVAIIDFRMNSPEGPPKAARIEPARVKAEMMRAGFATAEEHAFLPNQFFLVFRRAADGPAQGATHGSMQSAMHGAMHGMGHGMHGGAAVGHRPGAGMVSMLTRQDAASTADMGLVHELLANNRKIRRTVTMLPDGIRTVTESDDPQVAQAIKAHVASMSQRLNDGREFNIFSTTLPTLFENSDKIRSTVTVTEHGSIVVRTSADPRVVAALQGHATEVTELVDEGMVAMRRGMMTRMAGRPRR